MRGKKEENMAQQRWQGILVKVDHRQQEADLVQGQTRLKSSSWVSERALATGTAVERDTRTTITKGRPTPSPE